jgi:hypothetical protein
VFISNIYIYAIYHPRWQIHRSITWTSQQSSQLTCACVDRSLHAPTCLWPSWSTPCAPSEPTRSRSSRLTPRVQVPIQLSYFLLSLSHSTIFISHFAAMNSVILLHWTQPFSTVKPAILPEETQPFCQTVSKFSLSHFVAMNSSIFATMLNHFVILL